MKTCLIMPLLLLNLGGPPPLSVDQAAKAAMKQLGGKIMSAKECRTQDGKPVYVVKLLKQGRVQSYKIDKKSLTRDENWK